MTDSISHGRESTGIDESEIAFSKRDREDAARLLGMIAGPDRDLTSVARAIIRDRKRRERIFNRGMFGEPAWDMLLTLYAMDRQGTRLTIGRLAKEAACSLTTTLRWLEYLENDELVFRYDHPTDARVKFVSLTAKARDALGEYLSQTNTRR